jgi:hypothetical protein
LELYNVAIVAIVYSFVCGVLSAYDNGNKSSAGGLAKEREGIWKDERPTHGSSAGREEPTPTLLIPDYGGEDAWAKLSPASSARREPSPGLGEKKVTAVKKEIKTDDWDDFGTDAGRINS